jgi:hypothetical protein
MVVQEPGVIMEIDWTNCTNDGGDDDETPEEEPPQDETPQEEVDRFFRDL